MRKLMPDNIHPIHDRLLDRATWERRLGQRGRVLWFTGLSGSGKSTIAARLERLLHAENFVVKVLDGDNIRAGINNNLGFSAADRLENIRRIAEVAKLFVDAGIVVICSFVSPTRAIRQQAETIVGGEDFVEIFVDTPLELCEARDVKGLYGKARRGEIKNFTGIDAPYEAPLQPALQLKTADQSVLESAAETLRHVLPLLKL